MRSLLILALFLLPFSAFADDPVQAQSPRDANPAELVTLVEKVSAQLRTCAYARRNKDVEVLISNSTEDYIDKEPLITAFTKNLKLKVGGKKATLKAVLSSSKSATAEKFESTYTLNAKYLQNGKEFCEKTVSFTKTGAR